MKTNKILRLILTVPTLLLFLTTNAQKATRDFNSYYAEAELFNSKGDKVDVKLVSSIKDNEVYAYFLRVMYSGKSITNSAYKYTNQSKAVITIVLKDNKKLVFNAFSTLLEDKVLTYKLKKVDKDEFKNSMSKSIKSLTIVDEDNNINRTFKPTNPSAISNSLNAIHELQKKPDWVIAELKFDEKYKYFYGSEEYIHKDSIFVRNRKDVDFVPLEMTSIKIYNTKFDIYNGDKIVFSVTDLAYNSSKPKVLDNKKIKLLISGKGRLTTTKAHIGIFVKEDKDGKLKLYVLNHYPRCGFTVPVTKLK